MQDLLILIAAITAGRNNASNCHSGLVFFLSSDIPFSLYSAVLLQWRLLVGRPACQVFLPVFWVVGWNVCVRLKGWRGERHCCSQLSVSLKKKDVPPKVFLHSIGGDHILPTSVFRDEANIAHEPIPIISVSNQEVSTIFFTSEFLLYMAPQWLSWQSG
jgi:hypothetical protein